MASKPHDGLFQKIGDLFSRSRRSGFLGRFDFLQLALCALIIGLHIFLLQTGSLQRFEQIALDSLMRERPKQDIHPGIAVIEIKEDSIQTIGQWPWPLDYHAQIIELLNQWGARAIVFDMVLRPYGIPEEGDSLGKALSKVKNVYFPVSLETMAEKKIWVHALPVLLEPEGEKKEWLRWPAEFEQYAKGTGHVNIELDPDGKLRRISPFLGYGGQVYPHLALRVAYDYRNKPLLGPMDFSLPTDSEGRFVINWTGKWEEAFSHYSYADLIRSGMAVKEGLNPVITPKEIKGKICLIGLTGKGLGPTRVNPLQSNYPLLGVHANVINSVLTEQYVVPATEKVNMIALVVVGFIASILFFFFHSTTAFLAAIALGFVWLLVFIGTFWQTGIWIFAFQPLLLILSLFICLTLYDQLVTARERRRLFDLATRDGLTGLYVIRHFRDILNRVVEEAYRKKEPLSLVLIDLDNFKSINDTYGHPAGDMVLKKAAQVIHSKLRAKRPIHQVDFVGRYGGEEFIILLRNAEIQTASQKIGERVRASIEKTVFQWKDVIIPVTTSVGVATLRPEEHVPDAMVHRADQALYQAKRTGKNRVCIEE